jgi:hypothetical protein
MSAGPMDVNTKSLVFITYATKRFLPSLHIWLKHVRALFTSNSKGVVWLGADMSDADAALLRKDWPDFGFLPLPQKVPANSFEAVSYTHLRAHETG